MTVVEQRYRAVLAVEQGEPRYQVAAQFGVSRQTLHTWITRYRIGGHVDRRLGRLTKQVTFTQH
ncbi:helix-turn-helix domain-containing protein [Pseudonocardia sp. NPDC049635]|uniref:helix-turn-helix domain-containing protein n=1 Tax=Pseudonocardia sp. NPDC049635 TaxID=3155506 RepID=UPI0033F57916